jgi:hypothetical protein
VNSLVKGKLQPSLEEEMKKKGRGTIHVGIFRVQEGKVGDKEFRVDVNPHDIIVHVGDRTVLYDIREIIQESDKLIEREKNATKTKT